MHTAATSLPGTSRTLTSRQRWLALVVLTGSLLVVMMDMTILILALPALTAELKPTATEQLWIVDAYSLVLAGLLIPMSALADRWGRKKILLAGFVIFGVVSVLVLFADSPSSVIALRVLLGAGGAMIMPTTLSMIRSIFPDAAERARALAIWAVVASLGGIIGPVLGGALLQFFSWHSAFLINVPFVAIALIAGALLLPESRDPNPPRWDFLATLLAMAGMVAIVWGIKEAAKSAWADLGSWALIAAGLALMGLFVLRCLRRPDPLLDVRLFRSRPLTAGAIAAFTASVAMAGMLLLVAQWLQSVAGFSPMLAGVALLPMAIGSLIVGPFAPALARVLGTRNALAAGLAVAGAGLLWIFLTGGVTSYWQLVGPLALVGAGTGALAIASAVIMGSTPAAKAGNAAAIEESMYDLGNVLGVALLGSISLAAYRTPVDVDAFLPQGLTPDQISQVEESIAGAQIVAAETGITALGDQAAVAFADALGQASLIGAIVLLVAAGAVRLLVPGQFSITEQHHH
ncbi:MFS transporter [Microbacterium atlanticum]|uniref:MFS transporter n=1 Tax=Microbacterium atlanticum TaxID=2782168 RepID=UPI001E2BC07F|nr:MFS transporter [Microbacterium atlanticum]